jgi:hypothetical protein
MKTLIIIAAAVSLQFAATCQAVRVTNITGRAAITGNTCPNQARKEALDDAKLNALKAAGIAEKISCYQSLQTDQQDNDNNQSFQSHIQSDILGDVKYDSIVSEGMFKDTNNIVYYQVTIDALVTPYAPDPVIPYTTDVTPYKKIKRPPPTPIQPAQNCTSDCRYNNGDMYTGQFANGRRNGYGTYHWANGAQYTGYYKDGQRDGPGVFYGSNGKVMTGIWSNGIFTRYQSFALCQGPYANRNNYSGYGNTGSYGTTVNNNYNNVQQQQQQTPPTPQQKLDNDQSNFAQDVDTEQQKIEQ